MLPRITPIAIASHSPPNSYEDLRTYGSCQAVGGLACLFRSITRGWISALLSALGRSHCPCTAIHWGRTFSWRLQHGRTGSSALWLCRSHCRGIESQKGKRFHCFPLLGTFGSPEQEKPRTRGLLRRSERHRSALA